MKEFNAETEVAILKNNVQVLQLQLTDANIRIKELSDELVEAKRQAKILDDQVRKALEL
tara:strand:+ start:725 stop:901 length:177 start_codon:yes stop_codon:yes gene_type:complete